MPKNRHRLWSLTDSPIPYYLRRFTEGQKERRTYTEQFFVDDGCEP